MAREHDVANGTKLAPRDPIEAAEQDARPLGVIAGGGHTAASRPTEASEWDADVAQRSRSAALRALREDLGFDTASVFVRAGGRWELLERHGRVRRWHAVLDPSVLEGMPDAAEYADARTIPGVGPRLRRLGCASVATLPLPDGSRLVLDSATPCRLGGWIERARPYLSLVQELSSPSFDSGGALRRTGELAALERVFDACQRAVRDKAATLERLAAGVRDAVGADELFVLAERGADTEVVAGVDGLRARLPRDVQADLRPGDDAVPSETLARLASSLGMTSRALAGAYGRSDGALEAVVAGWCDGPALSETAMAVVARTVSTARAAVEARRQDLSTIIDRESARMAYALHDGLTQTVAGAVLELEALRRRVERDPAEALAQLDSSKREIRRALAELRSMLFDLSRGEDDRGAAEPLTGYIEDVVRRWKLPARVAVEGELARVPSRTLSVAYVVIREALANAAKHGPSANVTVSLAASDHELTVAVSDGGPGFTASEELAARSEHHYGLDMLRRRVHEAGGTLRIDSRPGAGTRVTARLPFGPVAS